MNHRIKLGILAFLILAKVTLFWNISYTYVVVAPLVILLLFTILFSVYRILYFVRYNPSYTKNVKVFNTFTNQEQVINNLEMLRRKDLSQFFEIFFALPILVNLLELVYFQSLSSGDEIMSNSILADIVWIIINMINTFIGRFLQKRIN